MSRFKKGESGNPNGRKAGVPNKATTAVREAFSAFVEGNMHRVQELFDRVAEDDPAKALDILDRLSAYTTPKLKAIEHSGKEGTEIKLEINAPNGPKP